MRNAYLSPPFRTPGCRAKKGILKDVRPDDLAAIAIKGLLAEPGSTRTISRTSSSAAPFRKGEQG